MPHVKLCKRDTPTQQTEFFALQVKNKGSEHTNDYLRGVKSRLGLGLPSAILNIWSISNL